MKITVLYSDPYGERFVGNLLNSDGFCTSCEPSEQRIFCDFCRYLLDSYVESIEAVYRIEKIQKAMLEDPQRFLPEIPKCDAIVAIALHPDIMLALPEVSVKREVKALISPIENPSWMSQGFRIQLERQCASLGLEYAFPKPFCSLELGQGPTIDEFIRFFRVGKPVFDVTVSGEIATSATVSRSSPCGSSWYIARKTTMCNIVDLPDVISKAHHAYPCTASMASDSELGDTILHKAGFIAYEAIYRGIRDRKAAKLLSEKMKERGVPVSSWPISS